MKGARVASLAFAVALFALPLVAPPFWVTLGNYIGLYSIVALGLVLLTGIAGQTSFGQAAFVGLGAYTTAYLTTHFGASRSARCALPIQWPRATRSRDVAEKPGNNP